MSTATAKIALDGAMGLIKKSKLPLAPLYEAITNAWEAILQKTFSGDEKPEIKVVFDFTGLVDEIKELVSVSVIDNGVGYTAENYNRFKTLLDNSKGYNNRGSGRLQFLHRFSEVEIVSYFEDETGEQCRKFSCDENRFIFSESCEPAKDWNGSGTRTTLRAKNMKEEKKYFDELTLADVLKDVKRHFLLRFYLDTRDKKLIPKITFIFTKNGEKLDEGEIDPKAAPQPVGSDQIKVRYVRLRETKDVSEILWETVPKKEEVISWAHFKLSPSELDRNGVFLCSKGVTVEPLPFKPLRKGESVNGSYYQTVFFGEILDDPRFITHAVDSFSFPSRKEVEKQIREGSLFFNWGEEFLFVEDIKDGVNAILPKIYSDVINVQEQQQKDVEEIARKHGIPLNIARQANININDSKEKITKKLYAQHAEHLAKENIETEKLFTELERLNPTAPTYQEDLQTKCEEILARIPQQNKEELSRYVIRRDMVTKVIKMILDQKLSCQNEPKKAGTKKDKEGLLHDLIFKRKSTTDGLNDLWILNEEFVHFDGCSELPLNQIADSSGNKLLADISDDELVKNGINPDRRPDVFLFMEERKCVLIEFKALDVDLTNHLNQMTKYCNLIANYAASPIDKFFCFLIGEKFEIIDLPGDYIEGVDGNFIKPYEKMRMIVSGRTEATAQIEVVKFSSVYKRAVRRNKSFADKLGLLSSLSEGTKL